MAKRGVRKLRPLPEHPLLIVEWVDASRLNDTWMDWGDIPDPYVHRCVSVGFLVHENKDAKILVPTVGDHEHEGNRHTYGGMMIPRSAIISERRLRMGEEEWREMPRV